MDVRHFRSQLHLTLVRLIEGKADVSLDGIGKKEAVLRHIGTALPDRMDRQIVDVLIVDENGAVFHIVGPKNQIHQRGLSGSCFSHNSHSLAGIDHEGNIFQNIVLPAGIAEGQILKLNLSLDVLDFFRAGAVFHMNLRIQKLTDTV